MSLLQESYISILNREEIEIKGVTDVKSYETEKICLDIDGVSLVLAGKNFYIKKVNIEEKTASITGILESMSFSDKASVSKSLLRSLFK